MLSPSVVVRHRAEDVESAGRPSLVREYRAPGGGVAASATRISGGQLFTGSGSIQAIIYVLSCHTTGLAPGVVEMSVHKRDFE